MVKFKVKDDKWTALVFETEEFDRRFEPGDAAYCDAANKQLIFDETELDLATVTHEMCHLYISYQYHSSAGLSVDQFEEIICELWAKEGAHILRQSRQLLKLLKKE